MDSKVPNPFEKSQPIKRGSIAQPQTQTLDPSQDINVSRRSKTDNRDAGNASPMQSPKNNDFSRYIPVKRNHRRGESEQGLDMS